MAFIDKFKITLANSELNSRRSFNVQQFFGVDYTEAQSQIASNHATEIRNIIYKDKVNQKRTGFEELIKATNIPYKLSATDTEEKINQSNINAVWSFVGEDEKEYVIAHIGSLLFFVKGIGEDKSFLEMRLEPMAEVIDSKYIVPGELENYKSTAFVGLHRLYILGGNKFYVLRINNGDYSLKAVENDENTYIPTTTIGITYKDSLVSSQKLLDDVNLLSKYRKNKLVSGTYVDDGISVRTTQFWDYELDTSILEEFKTDLNNIKITISSLRKVEN